MSCINSSLLKEFSRSGVMSCDGGGVGFGDWAGLVCRSWDNSARLFRGVFTFCWEGGGGGLKLGVG